MLDRRELLSRFGRTAGAALGAAALDAPRARAAVKELAATPGTPEAIATDEAFWAVVQRAFAVDRSLINLNNGGISPSPAVVQDAMRRYLEFSNQAPAYTMWRVLEPGRERVREALAHTFGCSPEEIAITRNTSESLQTCQFGFDLQPGDEVLTTTQDYPRMVATFQQLRRRRGIVVRQFPLPVPLDDPSEVTCRFAANLNERTRLILISHMTFLTGQVLPVRDVVRLGRSRGIPVVVDGAHAFAHIVFTQADLECDYYGTSLHKWLFAPHGTGMLYVARERIPGLWPLMAAPEEMSYDIRKFEEIGTHPAANVLAIAEALSFHHGIGPRRKEARLRYLRDRWAKRLAANRRVRLLTNLGPEVSGGIATFSVEGADHKKLVERLWDEHRIFVVHIKHPEFQAIRVSPSVYTCLEELDRFCDAIENLIGKGGAV